jgi:hypothetical protein
MHRRSAKQSELPVQRLEAKQILQALVQGYDPLTGDELPPGSVLQRAEIIRAMLAGISALEAGAARALRRSQLPENVGRPWTSEEEENLTAAFNEGESLATLAQRHGRTPTAIEARLEKLGLVKPEERVTSNRFIASRGAAQRPKSPDEEADFEAGEETELEDE